MPLLLEVGRESVTASAVDELLSELESELVNEAFQIFHKGSFMTVMPVDPKINSVLFS